MNFILSLYHYFSQRSIEFTFCFNKCYISAKSYVLLYGRHSLVFLIPFAQSGIIILQSKTISHAYPYHRRQQNDLDRVDFFERKYSGNSEQSEKYPKARRRKNRYADA